MPARTPMRGSRRRMTNTSWGGGGDDDDVVSCPPGIDVRRTIMPRVSKSSFLHTLKEQNEEPETLLPESSPSRRIGHIVAGMAAGIMVFCLLNIIIPQQHSIRDESNSIVWDDRLVDSALASHPQSVHQSYEKSSLMLRGSLGIEDAKPWNPRKEGEMIASDDTLRSQPLALDMPAKSNPASPFFLSDTLVTLLSKRMHEEPEAYTNGYVNKEMLETPDMRKEDDVTAKSADQSDIDDPPPSATVLQEDNAESSTVIDTQMDIPAMESKPDEPFVKINGENTNATTTGEQEITKQQDTVLETNIETVAADRSIEQPFVTSHWRNPNAPKLPMATAEPLVPATLPMSNEEPLRSDPLR